MLKFTMIVVSVFLWASLAVLGWGGVQAFFSHPALTALLAVLLVVTVVSFFAGGNLSPGEREDRGNRWVLLVFTIIGLLDGYLPALTDRKDFWTIDGNATRWLGVAVFALGCALRLWPVFVLGDRFSGLVAIQRGHTLLTTGIYRYVRNPSYLGVVVMTAGWGLAFRSGVGLLLAASFVPVLIARMHSEERLLQSHFGAEYEAYRARTWRLLPGIY